MDGRAGGQRERGRERFFFFDSTQKVSPKLVMLNFSKSQAMRMRILSLPAGEKRRLLPLTPCMAERATTVEGRGFFISSFPSPSARANTIVLLSTSLPFFPLRHPSIPTLPPSSSSTSFQKKSGSNRCHRREVRRVGSEGHLWRLFTTVGTPPPSSIGDWSQDLHGNWSCHWKKGKEEGGDLQSPITPRTERPAEPTGLFFYLPSSFFSFVMGRVGFKLLLQSLPSSSLGKTLSLRLHHHHSDSSRR